jgi:hypothetical protein
MNDKIIKINDFYIPIRVKISGITKEIDKSHDIPLFKANISIEAKKNTFYTIGKVDLLSPNKHELVQEIILGIIEHLNFGGHKVRISSF